MKKIVIATILFAFFGFSANADMTNIGVKISAATLDASGSHTTNSTSVPLGAGGAAVTSSGSGDFEMASFFVEREVEATDGVNIAIGLDVVPSSGTEVDKLGGGDGFDATVSLGNLMTAYIQPMFNASDNVSLFVKAGYSSADVDITDISRQATTAGTASTDSDQSKTLEGPMYGAGLQFGMSQGFIRLEGTFTDFDEISHTNSNGKVLKADGELTLISLSFGKSF